MTRREIQGAAKSQAKSFLKTLPEVDPLTMDQYTEQIVMEMCQASNGVYKTVVTALVAGQSTYCASSLHRIEETDIRLQYDQPDYAGIDTPQWIPITMVTSSEQYAANPWLLSAPQPQPTATPTIAIFQGLNKVRLYATPTYGWDEGIRFRGLGHYTSEDWPELDSECPLPALYHPTVRDGITALIFSYTGNDAGWRRFRALYDRGKGKYVSNAGSLTAAHDNRVPPASGGYGFGLGGPINNGPGVY